MIGSAGFMAAPTAPSQDEANEIMAGMENVWLGYWKHVEETAPRCHFTRMEWNMGDEADSWWECRHCGRTRDMDWAEKKSEGSGEHGN